MRKYFDTAFLITSVPAVGAYVYVYQSDGVTLAQLYSDNGVTPIANPLKTDRSGFYSFYVADGTYTLQYVLGGIALRTLTAVQIYDESTSSGAINEIVNGNAPDAGTLTGAETLPMSRGAGVLSTTLTKIAQWVIGTYQVNTIADLRALPIPLTGTVAKVMGYYAAGDCVPWDMEWIPTATSADNGGSVIAPNGYAGSGRWQCFGEAAADPDHWGALGTNGEIDFSRINVAIANAPDKYLRLRRNYSTSSTTSQINIAVDNFELLGVHRDMAGIQQVTTATSIAIPLINVTGNAVKVIGLDLGGGRAFDATEQSSITAGRNQLIYAATATTGVTVRDCHLHDCYRRGGTFSGNAPVLVNNIVERCGLYQTDLSPMDAGFRLDNSTNAVVHYNTVRKCGQYGICAPYANGIDIAFNNVDSPSMIGIGMNNATMPKVHDNTVSNTFNSGIDLQQCTKQLIYANALTYCGYGDVDYSNGLVDRVYQAIYCGDDATLSSTAASQCVGGAIYGNNIIGGWAAGGSVIAGTEAQTGCGIAMVSAQDIDVYGNTITGVGLVSYYTTVVQADKDGSGIKASNRCVGLRIHDNDISNCKLDGVTLGQGVIEFNSVFRNEIDKYARFGIAALGALGIEALNIEDNHIGEGVVSGPAQSILASIYIALGNSTTANALYVRRNYLGMRRDEATANNTHRLYFDILSGGTAWSLGVHEIADNDMQEAITANMYSAVQPSVISKTRHACRVRNNRSGNNGAGTVISTFTGMWDVPTEFTAQAAPTTGFYGAGARAWNPFPATGGPTGWVNVSSGSSGSWRVMGQNGVAIGATASRPTMSSMGVANNAAWAGTRYLDTTLSANGKPITWTGTLWVDATGASV